MPADGIRSVVGVLDRMEWDEYGYRARPSQKSSQSKTINATNELKE